MRRLHSVLRPFVLRRLKTDVESQMPGKYEHVVKCPLSKRQAYLYEEFMSRSSTRKYEHTHTPSPRRCACLSACR